MYVHIYKIYIWLSTYVHTIYCKEVLHVTVEAEKSRPWRVSGTLKFHSQSKGLRTRTADGVDSRSRPKAEEPLCSSLKTVRQRENSFLRSLLFCSGLQVIGCGPLTSALFSLPIQMLISFRNPVTHSPRIVFTHVSGHPAASSQVNT